MGLAVANIGLLVNGTQVSGAHFHFLYKLGHRCLEHTVRSLHVLETLAPVQSCRRRTGPSSPSPALLLVRVDTGGGAVRLALRRL